MIRVLYDVLDYGKLVAVSDAAYFEEYGPDEGDGPNYKKNYSRNDCMRRSAGASLHF